MCASGHGTLHRRLVVLRRAAAGGLHACRRRRALRESGGVGGKTIDRAAVDAYLREVESAGGHCRGARRGATIGGLRGRYLAGLADLPAGDVGPGDGDARQRASRSVCALRGGLDRRSRRSRRSRRRSASALPSCWRRAVTRRADRDGLLAAVDAWRRERIVPMASVRALGAAVIALLRQSERSNLLPLSAQGTCARCRAPTSSFCRSRTPGSPAR